MPATRGTGTAVDERLEAVLGHRATAAVGDLRLPLHAHGAGAGDLGTAGATGTARRVGHGAHLQDGE